MKNRNFWMRGAAILLMAGYLLFVLWTSFFHGGEYYSERIVLWPFASYRTAARQFDMQLWRRIILNICVMVPFGFLLPAAVPKMCNVWKVYPAGLLLIIAVEGGQLLSGRGVFETDDIIGNFLGVMIGYGFFRIVKWIVIVSYKAWERGQVSAKNSYKESRAWEKKEEELDKKSRLVPVLLCQIPLLVTVIGFAWIFIGYDMQELGNLDCAYASRTMLSDTDILVGTEFSDDGDTAMVYKVPEFTAAQADTLAGELFGGLGVKTPEMVTASDSMVCYHSTEYDAELWIDLKDGTYMLTDYTQRMDADEQPLEGQAGAEEAAVRSALKEWRIDLPQGCRFEEMGDGQYAFYAQQQIDGDICYDGTVICDYNSGEKLSRVDNQMIVCTPYKEFPVLSEKEAYGRLIAGKFYVRGYENGLGIESLEIRGINLGYRMDSKGFYQPVYQFESVVNGTETRIDLPAVRQAD